MVVNGTDPQAFPREKSAISRKEFTMTSAHDQQQIATTRRASGKRLFNVGLTLAVACLAASSAQANPFGGRISGSIFNPETGQTTTIVRGQNGSVRGVEDGNTLRQHDWMTPRRATSRMFGSLYDPETGRTTTISRGPNGSARSVEEG